MSATDIIYPRDFFPFIIAKKSDWDAANYGNSGAVFGDLNLSKLVKLYWAAKSMDWNINLGYSFLSAFSSGTTDTGTVTGTGTVTLPDTTGFDATIPGGRVVGSSYPIGFSGSTQLPVTVSGSISTPTPTTYSYIGRPDGLLSLFYIQWNSFGNSSPWPTPLSLQSYCAKGSSLSDIYTLFRCFGSFGFSANIGADGGQFFAASTGSTQSNLVTITVDGQSVPATSIPINVQVKKPDGTIGVTTLTGSMSFNFNTFY